MKVFKKKKKFLNPLKGDENILDHIITEVAATTN